MNERYFTVEEAREILPELRKLLSQANKDLEARSSRLQDLNQRYLKAELELDESQTPDDESENSLLKFRELRSNFEKAINELSREQSEYIKVLELWVDKISSHGVILRKMNEGLIDFPACNGDFKYYLCWQFGEDDITHWHLTDDGFIGRRALTSLLEYC